jgi:hypothetical protein
MGLTASQSEEDSDNIFVAMRYGEDELFFRRNLSNVHGHGLNAIGFTQATIFKYK